MNILVIVNGFGTLGIKNAALRFIEVIRQVLNK